MMETRSISLGNLIFQVELPAFEALGHYLDALREALVGTEGAEEIVQEVENRMAELFSADLAGASRAIRIGDVERVCRQLGDPADFREDEAPDGAPGDGRSHRPGGQFDRSRRRWFRDPDDRVVAGVASGIAYRFGVDPVIIRALFVALMFFTGTGLLFYLILSAIVPVAKTASDRLAMKGDPVTLESIMNSVESRLHRTRNQDAGGQRQWAVRWRHFMSESLPLFLKGLAKGIGWVALSCVILIILVFGALVLSTAVGVSFPW